MRIRIILLALIVQQCWTHPSIGQTDTTAATTVVEETETGTDKTSKHQLQQSKPQKDSPELDGESSKRIIGSSVVTSVSVILNGDEPEFTDALGVKVPKPQVPHLQVASPINLLNPDRYEFYTFDDSGELVKRLMTMQEIQSIVANGDGEGPTIIHSSPMNERDPEKNVQDIVKSVQNVLSREVESNKNSSDIQPILDTPDVSSSWSMILPAIFGNTGGDIFPQNKPQQVVMTPDSDVFEATTKANKTKPSGKPKPSKKKNGTRRKTTTKRVSTTTTAIPDLEAEAAEVLESTTRKVFINNQEVFQSTETGDLQTIEDFGKRHPLVAHGRPASTKHPQASKTKNKTKRPSTTTTTTTTTPQPESEIPTEPITLVPELTTPAVVETVTTLPVLTTLAPITIPAVPSTTPAAPVVVEENGHKQKPPQKKRKKPTRKPTNPDSVVEVSTEKHASNLHRRKQTARPYVHHKDSTTPQTSTAGTTTTQTPTASTTPVPSTSSTTTTTTTTTTEVPSSTSSVIPETTPTSHHHPHTSHKPSHTQTEKPSTSTVTSETYRPTPPTSTTEAFPTFLPPTSSSTSTESIHAPPNFIEEINVEDLLISSLKKQPIDLPVKLTEKEQQDHDTKLSFDQILQSLKEESSTDELMEASASEEDQMPAKLPLNNEPITEETESPTTMASINFPEFKKEEAFDGLDLDTEDSKKNEGPVVIITGRPQIYTSNKSVVPLVYISSDTTAAFEEPQRTTISLEDQTQATTVEERTIPTIVEEDGSASVVKFEPLFADVQDPVVTTLTTTELPQTTLFDDFSTTNQDEDTTQLTALPPQLPMDNIMQKIDNIIAMSLKSNESNIVEANTSQNQQAIPHISALTMSDFKTQAATMASILEDHTTSESLEYPTPSNSVENKNEIELLMSDVINQMTHHQSQSKPTLATETATPTAALPTETIEETHSPIPIDQEETAAQRLSNFAQINPALHLSVDEIKQTALRQPTMNESIKIITSVPIEQQNQEQLTTLVPDVEQQEPNYVLISQGSDDYPAVLDNSDKQSVEFEAKTEAATTPQEIEEEVNKTEKDDHQSLEENFDTTSPMSQNEENEKIYSTQQNTAEEEKSTEIPGETTVVFTDSDMEVSFEQSEQTTTVPSSLQLDSHLLHGEDPYIKLGETGAKPTVQSVAQMIYGQDSKAEQKTDEVKEPQSKIDENPTKMKNEYPTSEKPAQSDKDTLRISAEQPSPTVQSKIEEPINTEAELPQLLTVASITDDTPAISDEPLTSQAPSTTVPTKKPTNTLKPVSYFNKQSALIMNDQKFNAFQAAQAARPVVRPASLSNLKMPQSGATRPPVKLEPAASDSKGLESSTLSLDEDLRQFSQLCNELAFTYWRSITSEKISSARSLVISPFALTSMLSMVFLGARGSTSGEMNEVLKLDDMVTFNPHLVFKNVTESVERATDSDISSSAFVREAFSDRANGKILQFFKEKTQQFYSGHVEEVNFHVVNDVIRRRTNLLVKRHTMGKVMEYLRTNSVWVNGPLATISANLFQTDCSRASSADRDGEMFFQVHPSIRQRRLVPIPAVLFRTGFTAGYDQSLDATIVAFGKYYETVSTIYVMPGQHGTLAPADSLDLLESNLMETAVTKGAWSSILRSVMERPGLEVQLPRFSHRSFVNASLGLQKMGLKGLFNSELADLRGLTGLAAKDIYLSDMIQINTFSTCAEDKIGEHHHVEMYPAPPIRKRNKDVREHEDDENDSSEAVIDFGSIVQDTGMARAFYDDLLDPKFLELPLPLRPRQARIPDAPRLRFDRPFLYFVRHNPTGMILFMGRFNPRLLP